MDRIFRSIAIVIISYQVAADTSWKMAENATDIPAWASLEQTTGKVWYVSADSSAVGNGSVQQPFSTISAALNRAEPNDEIWLLPGVYRESVRIRKPHITLRSTELHQARIVVPYDEEASGTAVRVDPAADGFRLIGLDISGGFYYVVSLESRWGWGTADKNGVRRVVISQNRLHGSGRDVIKLKPMVSEVLIERNEIFNSGLSGVQNAEGIDNVNAHHMLVQDNYIHHVTTTGIYFKGGAQWTIVRRNLIEEVGFAGILIGFDTSPEFFDTVTNPQMFEAIDALVENNIVNGTQASGIGIYAARNAIVRFNTVLNSARNWHSALFFGNTLQDKKASAGRPPSQDIQIYGNIFHVDNPEPSAVIIRYMWDIKMGPLPALMGMPELSSNLYASDTGWVTFEDMRPFTRLRINRQLSVWQKHTLSDQSSNVATIQTDDHHTVLELPKMSGPALPAPETDFYLKPRKQFNLGAVVLPATLNN